MSDSINGNPIKSFPFEVTDYFAWQVANVGVSGNSISIKADLSRTKGDYVQGKIALLVGCWLKIFQK